VHFVDADASFANKKDLMSQIGYVVLMDDNDNAVPLAFRSTRRNILLALSLLLKQLPLLRDMMLVFASPTSCRNFWGAILH
jgi:hypothetical protein